MMRHLPIGPTNLLLAAMLALSGCAASSLSCGPGATAQVSEVLYFGRDMPAGEVSAADWAAFLRDAVTPRFPAGLTHWEAAGQWRGADGEVQRENSWVLNIVHPDDPAADVLIQRLIEEYRARFRQESVLRVRSAACVSF